MEIDRQTANEFTDDFTLSEIPGISEDQFNEISKEITFIDNMYDRCNAYFGNNPHWLALKTELDNRNEELMNKLYPSVNLGELENII